MSFISVLVSNDNKIPRFKPYSQWFKHIFAVVTSSLDILDHSTICCWGACITSISHSLTMKLKSTGTLHVYSHVHNVKVITMFLLLAHARQVSRWLEKLWSAALRCISRVVIADHHHTNVDGPAKVSKNANISPPKLQHHCLKRQFIYYIYQHSTHFENRRNYNTHLTSQPLTKWILMTQACTNKRAAIWKLNSYYCQRNCLKTWFCSINLRICF